LIIEINRTPSRPKLEVLPKNNIYKYSIKGELMEREKFLRGMLDHCYKNKETYKTMIAKIEKELKIYGECRKEGCRD